MPLKNCWWAIYKDFPRSKDNLIAFVKGNKKQMGKVLVGVYLGTVSITREEPTELNYQLNKNGEPVIHTLDELDAVKISRRIFPREKPKVKENASKIWYQIDVLEKNKKSQGKKVPNAYLVNSEHIKEYSLILKPEIDIGLTKKPKNLEFKVIDENKKVIGFFNQGRNAKFYNNKFLGGLGKVTSKKS